MTFWSRLTIEGWVGLLPALQGERTMVISLIGKSDATFEGWTSNAWQTIGDMLFASVFCPVLFWGFSSLMYASMTQKSWKKVLSHDGQLR